MFLKKKREKEFQERICSLTIFSEDQKLFLMKVADQRILLIAESLDEKIQSTEKQMQYREQHFKECCEESPDQVEPDIKSEEMVKAISLLNQLEALKDSLCRAKERFLKDPFNYGVCEKCHRIIPKERLEEVPQAHLCVACKEKRSFN